MKQIFYRTLATFMFFTRLPLWKIANVPAEHFKKVVPLWPLVGWLTGGIMACVYIIASMILPSFIAIILALVARVLLTGALHEDGFADFCDGFGGGTTRERTLEIMKDSHIGTYGVLGLILYFTLIIATLHTAAPLFAPGIRPIAMGALLMCGDTFCKWTSSTIIYTLPYARKAEEAKNKLVYASVTFAEKAISIILGTLPIILLREKALVFLPSMVASVITCLILFLTMKKRIQGYTGDCCGATFIISELVFHFTALITLSLISI
ncbi:MAG: adenosylcobinamide-GDP ribazoletransferase [Prevotellaceae bacterium]|nr:adenosylcobinamide-GDP ribazoletransferase [Candidatus Minthosoma caballi]